MHSLNEPRRSKIGSSKEIVGECKYLEMISGLLGSNTVRDIASVRICPR